MGDQNEAGVSQSANAAQAQLPAVRSALFLQLMSFVKLGPNRSSIAVRPGQVLLRSGLVALEFSKCSALFTRSTLHVKVPANADGFLRGN